MADKKPMTEKEIVAFIGRKVSAALNDEGGDISDTRQENFDYYMGEKYGNERDGYSSVVTRECLEATEWALASILPAFTSGDKAVVFDPVGPEDEDQAEQETDVANHYLLKEGNGFMLFHHWIKDCLRYQNGYIKVWMEETEETHVDYLEGLSAEELALVDAQEDVEIEEAETSLLQTELGPIEVYSVKVRRTERSPRLRAEPIPGEEVLIDNDLLSIDVDEADFVCHRVQRSFTWLVENGYDQDELEGLSGEDGGSWNDERTNRLFYEEENPDTDDDDDDSMRLYWVHECYCRLDVDGDGLAERRRIVVIGDRVFENEEDSYQSIVSMSCMPEPHKHTGQALLDLVKDIQLIKSTLLRQLLDNLYRINVPRKYVGEAALVDGGMTMDALLDANNEFIPTRDPNAVVPEVIQPLVTQILPVIQYMEDQKESRTGVNHNISLDPDVLQNTTKGAFLGAMEKASKRLELYTRIFAETGIKQLMRKVHRLMRENMDKEKTIRIRGKWVAVNPMEWRDRANLTVNVGLGTGDKERQMGILLEILGIQKEALQIGLATPQNIYNALEKLTETAGLKGPERYFTNPANQQPQQPQPDPMQEAMQQQLALAQQDQARKDRESEVKIASQMAEMNRKFEEFIAKMENMNLDSQKKAGEAAKAWAEAGNTAMQPMIEGMAQQASSIEGS